MRAATAGDQHPVPKAHPWDCKGGKWGGQPTVGLVLGLAQAWSRAWLVPCPLIENNLCPGQGVSGRCVSPDTVISSSVMPGIGCVCQGLREVPEEDGHGAEICVSYSLLLQH